MPGRWFSTTAERFVEYESLLERDWMLLMDFDREVDWICEQPLRLRYLRDGKPASHVPDLLVWRGHRAAGPPGRAGALPGHEHGAGELDPVRPGPRPRLQP